MIRCSVAGMIFRLNESINNVIQQNDHITILILAATFFHSAMNH